MSVGDAEAEVPDGRFLDGAVLVHGRGREATGVTTEGAPDTADTHGPNAPPAVKSGGAINDRAEAGLPVD